jgi:hypothetical protein
VQSALPIVKFFDPVSWLAFIVRKELMALQLDFGRLFKLLRARSRNTRAQQWQNQEETQVKESPLKSKTVLDFHG